MDEQIRILCVDDERNVLRALERVFLDDDYEILTALSAEEGLTLLQEQPSVQVVISDYRMPGLNGVDFLKEVHRLRPESVRIVLSGYADTAAVVSAINEGQIYKFIPKPWNDDELKVTIQNALEKYRLERSNAQLLEELQVANRNLESTVAARTAKLFQHNRSLKVFQNILHALPFAVLGFDAGGTLVQCNQVGIELFQDKTPIALGKKRAQLLPAALNADIDAVATASCVRVRTHLHARTFTAWITHLKEGEQEGIILVLQPEA